MTPRQAQLPVPSLKCKHFSSTNMRILWVKRFTSDITQIPELIDDLAIPNAALEEGRCAILGDRNVGELTQRDLNAVLQLFQRLGGTMAPVGGEEWD